MTISIITATYNSAATLRSTFDSILQQTYRDIDYIVIDGGSTDGTIDIIREYEPRFG
ncbi:MAG: glycosyltransferase, partial [Bacteroidales bacterium]|nr:glycosyltransferase [Bacteroidales bacterium]